MEPLSQVCIPLEDLGKDEIEGKGRHRGGRNHRSAFQISVRCIFIVLYGVSEVELVSF
jgi:hypothetical protein